MSDWAEVKRVVGAALELPQHDREAFLSAQISDSSLLTVARDLVRASDLAGDFLLDPTIDVRGSRIPETIGRYPIEARLGRGGTGVVYRARDPLLDRPVAIKVLHDGLPGTEHIVREARTLARCAHPNIATLYALDETSDGKHFLVMELVEGVDLADRLREGPLPIASALAVARQVGEALRAAHANGIVHRDLKPRNVRVDQDGGVKVLDFGIARRSSRGIPPAAPAEGGWIESVTSDIAGTPGYMSPEQRNGDVVDARSDLYAFGAVLFECITGQRAETKGHVDWNALSSETPPALRSLLERCLAQSPEDRPASVETVLAELQSLWDAYGPPRRSGEAILADRPMMRLHAPSPLTRFIGRERELAQLRELLLQHRLVTITGSGGCGASRLALQLAREAWVAFQNGAYWVPLESVPSGGEVAAAVLAALEELELPGKTAARRLVEILTPREMLLVLDGCEHVQAETARLAEDILRSCARVKVVVTSLQRLGLSGEITFSVPPLSLPAEGADLEQIRESESVCLFIERARESQRTFVLSEENARDVAALCRHLDGLPLAIELAAARVRAMTPAQLLDRLMRSLTVLGGVPGGPLPRQRTMRAVYDWGFDLLGQEERALLQKLSVFAGGATLEAVEAVCTEDDGPRPRSNAGTVEVLSALVEKSQVFFTHAGGEGRYHLLQTARLYSGEKLHRSGQLNFVRDRHAEFYLSTVERADRVTDEKRWLDSIEIEHSNVIAALQHAIAQDHAALALRLVNATAAFWNLRGHSSSGRSLLLQAIAIPGAENHARLKARALEWTGHMDMIQGDVTAAEAHYEEALAIYRLHGTSAEVAGALCSIGNLALDRHQPTRARDLLEESRRSSENAGDEHGVARSSTLLAVLARREGNIDEAEALDLQALAIFRRLGEKGRVGSTLIGIANGAVQRGDLSRARELYVECLALARELGLAAPITGTLNNLATVASLEGDHERAVELYSEALQLAKRASDPRNRAVAFANKAMSLMSLARLEEARHCLHDCFDSDSVHGAGGDLTFALKAAAMLAARVGAHRTAGLLFGASGSIQDSTGELLEFKDNVWEETLDFLRNRPETTLEPDWEAGRALSTDAAIEIARSFLSTRNS